MSGTSSAKSFLARMEARAEADREKMQEIVDAQVKRLERGVAKSVREGLSTIERDIQARAERSVEGVRAAIWNIWLRPLVVGVMLSLGLFAGTAGWSEWLTTEIGSMLQQSARLDVQIEEQRETLERITATTWGVEFVDNAQGRFLVAPVGALFDVERWTFGRGTPRERNAVRILGGR